MLEKAHKYHTTSVRENDKTQGEDLFMSLENENVAVENQEQQNNVNEQEQEKQPKSYSEEEYQKVVEDLKKMKGYFDKASSELATFKKEKRESMSEVEKLKADCEELQAKLQANKVEKEKASMLTGLAKFSVVDDNANALVDAFVNHDSEAFSKAIDVVFSSTLGKMQEEINALKLGGTKRPSENGDNTIVDVKRFKSMTVDERMALKKQSPNVYQALVNQSRDY